MTPLFDVLLCDTGDFDISIDIADENSRTGADGGPDNIAKIIASVEKILGSLDHDRITDVQPDVTQPENNGSNVLIGSDGDDILIGGDGDDVLIASGGMDALVGGGGTDTVDFSDVPVAAGTTNREVGSTVRIDLGTGSIAADGYGSTDTISGVENVVGSNGHDIIIGDKEANSLIGNRGDDILKGGDGDDVAVGGRGHDDVDGGNGDDIIDGGDGDDVLRASDGVDHMFGGKGVDTADFSGVPVSNIGGDTLEDAPQDTAKGVTVVIDLATGTVSNDGYGNTGTITGVENIAGSAGHDAITGDDQANVLIGNRGNDTINAGGGDDTIIGGRGKDDINGGDGRDIIDGGLGGDRLAGGQGADVFLFAAASGHDTIQDFSGAAGGQYDTIDLSMTDREFDTFADVLAASKQADADNDGMEDDVVIDLGGGNMLTLIDVELGNLVESDFGL